MEEELRSTRSQLHAIMLQWERDTEAGLTDPVLPTDTAESLAESKTEWLYSQLKGE